jgi:hypothetical protein
VARNGKHTPPRPRIEIAHSSASPVEAAAIAAGIEQFLRDTTRVAEPEPDQMSPWLRAGLMEGIGIPAEATPWV